MTVAELDRGSGRVFRFMVGVCNPNTEDERFLFIETDSDSLSSVLSELGVILVERGLTGYQFRESIDLNGELPQN